MAGIDQHGKCNSIDKLPKRDKFYQYNLRRKTVNIELLLLFSWVVSFFEDAAEP